MKFKVGDEVAHLDSTESGVVLEIKGDELRVEDDNGFDTWYHFKELVKKGRFEVDHVPVKDQPRTTKGQAGKKFAPNELVKDLHFNQLVDYPKNFTNFQMLEIQIREAKKAIDHARRAGIKKVVLIHGVGEGRLREEVHSMLERMDKLRFYDASYDQFGSGATEVELF